MLGKLRRSRRRGARPSRFGLPFFTDVYGQRQRAKISIRKAQISDGKIALVLVLIAYYNKPSKLFSRKKYMIETETGYTRAARASIEFDAATAAVTDDIQPKKHSMTHPAIKEAIELLNKLGYTLAAYALERMSQPVDATPQPASPYGWIVTGSLRIFTGKYAQTDAKQEAAHCGGTAKAVALFDTPQPVIAPAQPDAERETFSMYGSPDLQQIILKKLKEKFDAEQPAIAPSISDAQPVMEPTQPLTNAQRCQIFDSIKYESEDGWEINFDDAVDAVESAHGITRSKP